MKRVTIFGNGKCTNGKVIAVPSSLKQLLSLASQKLGINAVRIYTEQGGEIDDVTLIRDNEVLFIANEEPFLKPSHALDEGISEWIRLNVGGKIFSTSRCTLISQEPYSMLARMFASEMSTYQMAPSAQDETGAYLIDRSPTYFEPILNYLRHGKVVLDSNINPEGVLEEARFFGMENLASELEYLIAERRALSNPKEDPPLTRKDVIAALVTTSPATELRFQGVNLTGADLSRLDLRNINFKYAILRGCQLTAANLSWCCLERADLSGAILDNAQLLGVKMLCANVEGASLRGCNFEDPAGSRANMEGVNLKGARLQESNMAGVNLRVATLKNANMQNCVLRGAVLAGADLENCDLSGSDLQEANLRGANLKNTTLELMLTPLHMSQTIR